MALAVCGLALSTGSYVGTSLYVGISSVILATWDRALSKEPYAVVVLFAGTRVRAEFESLDLGVREELIFNTEASDLPPESPITLCPCYTGRHNLLQKMFEEMYLGQDDRLAFL